MLATNNKQSLYKQKLTKPEEISKEPGVQILYSRLKLKNVQEILIDKSRESIQLMFEAFVKEHLSDDAEIVKNKLIFYCLLKTEGDVMTELRDYHRAIQAYK